MAEKRQQNDTPKRVIPAWFFLLVLLLLGFALFGDRGVLKVFKSYQQKTELEEKISELEKSNVELRREIDALHNDLKTIENIARRELGMVRPDEQVYQFHSDGKDSIPQLPAEEPAGTVDDGRVDTYPVER